MRNHSDYSDAQPKFGGAYTGWRPRESRKWSWLGLLPLAACIAALAWKVFQ